jgi:hypothetical protein
VLAVVDNETVTTEQAQPGSPPEPLPQAVSGLDPYAFIHYAGAETPEKAVSEGYASLEAARQDQAQKEIASLAAGAEAKKEYAAAERAAIEPIFRQREKATAEVPLPKSFEPTQTNSQDLMSLFTLTGIAGMMLGRGGGRQAAVGAQQAMTGMINGYMAGRADLVERERKNFDANTRLLEARRKEINEAFDVAMKEATTIGVSEAKSNLEQKLAASGADILLAKVRTGTIEKGLELTKEINALAQKRQESVDKLTLGEQQIKARRADIVREGDKYFLFNRATREFLINPETGERLEAPAPGRAGSASGPGGVIQFRYNQAVANAAYQASIEVQNYVSMPLSAAPPAAAEILTDPAKNITNAAKQYFAGKWTRSENRAVQQSLTGLNRTVAAIAAGGRPGGITEASIKEFAKMAPRAGDSKINTYLYLAMIRQEFDVAVKDLQAAQANPEQIRLAELARDNAYKVIPFTVADVTRIMRAGGPAMVNANTTALLAASNRIKAFEMGLTRQPNPPEVAAAPAPAVEESENYKKAKKAILEGGNREKILERMLEAGENIEGL